MTTMSPIIMSWFKGARLKHQFGDNTEPNNLCNTDFRVITVQKYPIAIIASQTPAKSTDLLS